MRRLAHLLSALLLCGWVLILPLHENQSDGTVKVLDFGLAKPTSADAASPFLSQSPTATIGGTRDGVILGTAAYMSPEQARGKAIDKRTDIWAFGCVLYEMLTGYVPFAGETVSDMIGKILEREPDWSALPAATPVPIRRLLLRCFAKDPKQRLRDIGEARLTLDEPEATVVSASASQPRLAWILAAAELCQRRDPTLVLRDALPRTAAAVHLQSAALAI
jgi:serine/threonine protein kinase